MYHSGGHHWNYYAGTLSFSQVTATHLKIGIPRSSNELQWLDIDARVPGQHLRQCPSANMTRCVIIRCRIDINISNLCSLGGPVYGSIWQPWQSCCCTSTRGLVSIAGVVQKAQRFAHSLAPRVLQCCAATYREPWVRPRTACKLPYLRWLLSVCTLLNTA